MCSRSDRQRLESKYNLSNVKVAPNIVSLPLGSYRRTSSLEYNLLFVGNLNYFPNRDAVLFFAQEILPILKTLLPQPVQLRIVGSGDSDELRKIEKEEDIELIGRVADVTEYYAKANLVIAPLRAGGGTRIKILEAFAHCVPVVSTSVGAAGIDAHTGAELLIADTPQDFAQACCDVLSNEGLSSKLTQRAFQCVSRKYSPKALMQNIQEAI